ncbi:ArsR/SmtB family transcription factor [Gorillibacterium timonense]|uniref:ArsR/SmtB family transcription factor n=1 Tax=Gorillibacterium timonense TaxID=1689269 RepID=UPI00071D0E20|nr:ArsR family transcriptional regulator [Gorillibacterium timonense]
MFRATTDAEWLPLYEALASEVRLRILNMLAVAPMNIKDLAEALGLSSAIVTMHVKKLEKGKLIQTELVRRNGGTHKMCSIAVDRVEILLPDRSTPVRRYHEVSVPVGHYSSVEVLPTCGLARKERIIGQFDDTRYFLDPERMHAEVLWFGSGFIEYRIPNYLLASQSLEEIEISLEIGSEAPGTRADWPSDIHFYLNGILLGFWTSPGDPGESKGRLNPSWWTVNQHGWLKVLRVTEDGTYVDGQWLSDVSLQDFTGTKTDWTLKIAVPDSARHVGGLTLYGKGFGNYEQDIFFRTYYKA